MRTSLSRRAVLRNLASVGAGVWIATGLGRGGESASPNEKLNIAVVGCGGQGGENLKQVAGLSQSIVALCDVDERSASGAFLRKDTSPASRRAFTAHARRCLTCCPLKSSRSICSSC